MSERLSFQLDMRKEIPGTKEAGRLIEDTLRDTFKQVFGTKHPAVDLVAVEEAWVLRNIPLEAKPRWIVQFKVRGVANVSIPFEYGSPTFPDRNVLKASARMFVRWIATEVENINRQAAASAAHRVTTPR